jgi:hypothetical protein
MGFKKQRALVLTKTPLFSSFNSFTGDTGSGIKGYVLWLPFEPPKRDMTVYEIIVPMQLSN